MIVSHKLPSCASDTVQSTLTESLAGAFIQKADDISAFQEYAVKLRILHVANALARKNKQVCHARIA